MSDRETGSPDTTFYPQPRDSDEALSSLRHIALLAKPMRRRARRLSKVLRAIDRRVKRLASLCGVVYQKEAARD